MNIPLKYKETSVFPVLLLKTVLCSIHSLGPCGGLFLECQLNGNVMNQLHRCKAT